MPLYRHQCANRALPGAAVEPHRAASIQIAPSVPLYDEETTTTGSSHLMASSSTFARSEGR